LRSNSDTNEAATSVTLDSDGFTLGGESENNGGSMVAWNWKAGGTAVSNTVGDITSSVSANTDSGFSIVSYTGTGVAGTIGHGLTLNLTSAVNGTGVGGVMNDTAPTTSLFTVGNDSRSNGSGNSMIAYCFAEVKGFSKFGSYTGNGSVQMVLSCTQDLNQLLLMYKIFKCFWCCGIWIAHDNTRIGY
jgi:hypothetical protein